MENLLSLSKYIDVMRKLTTLATGVKGISYFIATDDMEAEKMMRSSFEDGADFYLENAVMLLQKPADCIVCKHFPAGREA